MIESAQTVMSLAYVFFLLSVLPNVKQVWENRNKLQGFSRFGISAVTIGLVLTQVALGLDGAWVPVIIGIPNLLYYFGLSYFLWRKKS